MIDWKRIGRRINLALYVDESGWTGPNYEDEAQPTVFFGGILVPTDKCEGMEQGVLALIKSARGQGVKEVKGRTLFGRGGRGSKNLARDILRCAHEHEATFLSSGVDKYLQACAMILVRIHNGPVNQVLAGTELDQSMDLAVRGARPTHWIDAPELTDAYMQHLNTDTGKQALLAWITACMPDPATNKVDHRAVASAVRLLSESLSGGTGEGITLRELLSTDTISMEQREAACSSVEAIVGREARVSDLFVGFNPEFDVEELPRAMEPGTVGLTNLVGLVYDWIELLGSSVEPPVDAGQLVTVDILQDEPASKTYEGLYRNCVDIMRRGVPLTWLTSHEFAKSHEQPGIVVADVLASLARLLYAAAVNGRGAEWDKYTRVIMRPGRWLSGVVAKPDEMERWKHYQESRFA